MISAITFPGSTSASPTDVGRRTALRALRELVVMAGLFVLYRQIRFFTRDDTDAALDNADRIVAWERRFGLFNERTVQRAALQVQPVIDVLDHYYVLVHFPLTFTFLGWVWWRRREAYAAIRTWFVGVTAAALAVHVAFPLAPPRMLDGFVDTLAVHGPNIYPSDPHDSVANQFAAMPSLHFGWAAMVAIGWIVTHRGRARHLAWIHPIVTLLAIVATANHYWTDAAVAGVLVAGIGVVALRRSVPGSAANVDDAVVAEVAEVETVAAVTVRRCSRRPRVASSRARRCPARSGSER
jgi:hypothetical protein